MPQQTGTIFDRIDAEAKGGAIPPPPISDKPTGTIFDDIHAEEQERQKNQPPPPKPFEWSSLIPSAHTILTTGGATVGGLIGGAGGTVGGMGVGAVPGAIIGGTAGGSIGESLYQLGARAGLFDKSNLPSTPGDVAAAQAKSAALGGIQEAIPPVIGKLAKPVAGMLRSGAARGIAKVSEPISREAEAEVLKVAPEALKTMPIATSTSRLFGKYGENLARTRTALENAYNALPAKAVSSSSIIQKLNAARNKYMIQGGAAKGMEPVVKTYDGLIDWFTTHPDFSPQELRQVRQVYDEMLDPSEIKEGLSAVQKAYRTAGTEARNLINTTFPTVANANREVYVAKTLHDTLAKAAPRLTLQERGALDIGAGLGAAGIAYASGHPGVAAGAGITSAITREVMGSTLWKTASIAIKKQAADLLSKGNVEGAIRVLTPMARTMGQTFLTPPPNLTNPGQ